MLLYDSLNLIISGVYNHIWAAEVERLDYVAYKTCQYAVLLKDKIIIRNVFSSYKHFLEMVEHLNNAIH